MNNVYASSEVVIDVPFHDIDLMGVAWHGHYAKYLELARTSLFQSFDYDLEEMKNSGYAWPVIELYVRYAQPLKYCQKIQVKAALVEIENRVKIKYVIYDLATGRRLTRAHTVQVAVDISKMQMLFACPVILKKKLGLA